MSALAQVGIPGVDLVDQIWWFTSRAAGIIAWILLSLSVIAGMTMSTRDSRLLPTGWPIDLHRFLSMLSLTFLTIHMLALIPDNFVEFGLRELFVPMASTWQPGSVAWGIVAFWLVVAVEATSLLRSRIPNRVWRAIHMLSFVVWATSTVHLFMAGTDVGHPAFRVTQFVVIATVLALFVRRVRVARARGATKQAARSAAESGADEADTAPVSNSPVSFDDVLSSQR